MYIFYLIILRPSTLFPIHLICKTVYCSLKRVIYRGLEIKVVVVTPVDKEVVSRKSLTSDKRSDYSLFCRVSSSLIVKKLIFFIS